MVSILESCISPSMRSFGRTPAVMCRSDAPRSMTSWRRLRRLNCCADVGAGAAGGEGGAGVGATGAVMEINLGREEPDFCGGSPFGRCDRRIPHARRTRVPGDYTTPV